MILSGLEIVKKVEEGKEIFIEPFDASRVGPNSYDLRLNNILQVYDIPKGGNLDMRADHAVREIVIPEDGFVLEPGQLYLGSTVEFTETKAGYVPMLEGRSSVGRLGVSIHVTAGFGDIGFAGHWTLEIWSILPVRIYPFERICQIYYHKIDGEYSPYKGKYQGAMGVQASRKYRDV